jgi:hypothetical protein
VNEPTPIRDNGPAHWVGRILHPFWLPLPTALVLLRDRPIPEALGWLALTIGLVMLPSAGAVLLFERRGRPVHERQNRRPLYLIGLLCVLVCLMVLLVLDAPAVLIACLAALLVWAVVQAAINAFVTKVSGHTAVAAGCIAALLVTGSVTSPIVIALLFALLVLVGWARLNTRDHTPAQVVLGAIVGALPALVVFPLILR